MWFLISRSLYWVRCNTDPTVCHTHTVCLSISHTTRGSALHTHCPTRTLSRGWSLEWWTGLSGWLWAAPLEVLLQTHHVQNWAEHLLCSRLTYFLSWVPPSANAPWSSLSPKPEHWALIWTPPLFSSLQLIDYQVLMMLLLSILTALPSLVLRTYNMCQRGVILRKYVWDRLLQDGKHLSRGRGPFVRGEWWESFGVSVGQTEGAAS